MSIFSCAPGIETLPPEESDCEIPVPVIGLLVWLSDLRDVLPANLTFFAGPEEKVV